jgi:hypothetical protein
VSKTMKWFLITVGSLLAVAWIGSVVSPPEKQVETKTVVGAVPQLKSTPVPQLESTPVPKPTPKAKPAPKPAPQPKVDPDAAKIAEVMGLARRGLKQFHMVQTLSARGQRVAYSGDMSTLCDSIVPSLERHINAASGIVSDLNSYGALIHRAGPVAEQQLSVLEKQRDTMQRNLGAVQDICATS